MDLLNPKKYNGEHLDEKSREIMLKTIEFFESMGKAKLKEKASKREWYADFLEFIKENKIFYTLMTPPEYADGDPNVRWDTWRICDFSELLAFYSLDYWYTWQVTVLGLGPIWMSKNEKIKREVAELLKNGAVFALSCQRGSTGQTSTLPKQSSFLSLTARSSLRQEVLHRQLKRCGNNLNLRENRRP